jgi:hypothetical protein
MSTQATFTTDQITAAKAIASADVKVHHAAAVVGQALALVKADDQTALTAFWKALGAEMNYGPHADYWATHNTGGRKAVSTWAAFYRAADRLSFDRSLAFTAGKVPTVAAIRAFTTGADSLDVDKLTASLTGKDAQPFHVKAVKDALGIIKRGAQPAKGKGKGKGKGDKDAEKAAKAIKDGATAQAKAIVKTAKDDAKAVTLGRMVSFIEDQADDAMLDALTAAIAKRRARNAAAESIG